MVAGDLEPVGEGGAGDLGSRGRVWRWIPPGIRQETEPRTENSVPIYMPGADLNETTLKCQGKMASRPGRIVLVGDPENRHILGKSKPIRMN